MYKKYNINHYNPVDPPPEPRTPRDRIPCELRDRSVSETCELRAWEHTARTRQSLKVAVWFHGLRETREGTGANTTPTDAHDLRAPRVELVVRDVPRRKRRSAGGKVSQERRAASSSCAAAVGHVGTCTLTHNSHTACTMNNERSDAHCARRHCACAKGRCGGGCSAIAPATVGTGGTISCRSKPVRRTRTSTVRISRAVPG